MFIINFQRQNARPLSLFDVHWMADAFRFNTYAMEPRIVWTATTRIHDSVLQVTNELTYLKTVNQFSANKYKLIL